MIMNDYKQWTFMSVHKFSIWKANIVVKKDKMWKKYFKYIKGCVWDSDEESGLL